MPTTRTQAVAAPQVLLERAYGKPKPSEEEMDATRTGFQYVIVHQPTDISLRTEERKEPEFIESEVVESWPN